MSNLGPVLDRSATSVAPSSASPELAIESVQHLALDLAEQLVAEHGAHVSIEVADVRLPRRVVEVDDLEIPVEELVAFVRGFRRSSSWLSSRLHAFSASAAARGPAGTTPTRS